METDVVEASADSSVESKMNVKLDGTFVFKYRKQKYALSFRKVYIDDYADVPGLPDFRGRGAVLCIIRKAMTGQPFTGIAIQHPMEYDKSSVEVACATASKRAIQAMAAEYNFPWKEMYQSYRYERTGRQKLLVFAKTLFDDMLDKLFELFNCEDCKSETCEYSSYKESNQEGEKKDESVQE